MDLVSSPGAAASSGSLTAPLPSLFVRHAHDLTHAPEKLLSVVDAALASADTSKQYEGVALAELLLQRAPLPFVVNNVLLRLADLFHTCQNVVRFFVCKALCRYARAVSAGALSGDTGSTSTADDDGIPLGFGTATFRLGSLQWGAGAPDGEGARHVSGGLSAREEVQQALNPAPFSPLELLEKHLPRLMREYEPRNERTARSESDRMEVEEAAEDAPAEGEEPSPEDSKRPRQSPQVSTPAHSSANEAAGASSQEEGVAAAGCGIILAATLRRLTSRVTAVTHSTDPIARQLALRTLEDLIPILGRSSSTHQCIRRGLGSRTPDEVEAACGALQSASAFSPTFAVTILPSVDALVFDVGTPHRLRIQLIWCLQHMHSSPAANSEAFELCERVQVAFPTADVIAAALGAQTKMCVRGGRMAARLLDTLLRMAVEDVYMPLRRIALFLAHRLVRHFPAMEVPLEVVQRLLAAPLGTQSTLHALELLASVVGSSREKREALLANEHGLLESCWLLLLDHRFTLALHRSLLLPLLPRAPPLVSRLIASLFAIFSDLFAHAARSSLPPHHPSDPMASEEHLPEDEGLFAPPSRHKNNFELLQEVGHALVDVARGGHEREIQSVTRALLLLPSRFPRCCPRALYCVLALAHHLVPLVLRPPSTTCPPHSATSTPTANGTDNTTLAASSADGPDFTVEHVWAQAIACAEIVAARNSPRLSTIFFRLLFSLCAHESSATARRSMLSSAASFLSQHSPSPWVRYRFACEACSFGFFAVAEPALRDTANQLSCASNLLWMEALCEYASACRLLEDTSSPATTPSAAISAALSHLDRSDTNIACAASLSSTFNFQQLSLRCVRKWLRCCRDLLLLVDSSPQLHAASCAGLALDFYHCALLFERIGCTFVDLDAPSLSFFGGFACASRGVAELLGRAMGQPGMIHPTEGAIAAHTGPASIPSMRTLLELCRRWACKIASAPSHSSRAASSSAVEPREVLRGCARELAAFPIPLTPSFFKTHIRPHINLSMSPCPRNTRVALDWDHSQSLIVSCTGMLVGFDLKPCSLFGLHLFSVFLRVRVRAGFHKTAGLAALLEETERASMEGSERGAVCDDLFPPLEVPCVCEQDSFTALFMLPFSRAHAARSCTLLVECVVVDRQGTQWSPLINGPCGMKLRVS